MEFSIREANPEDYQTLCELFAEVDGLHHEALPHVFGQPGEPARTREHITHILAAKETTLFVAESNKLDGAIIGLVHVAVREAPDAPTLVSRRFGWISDIVVAKDWRRLGVGQLLAQRAEQWLLECGVREVRLWVWEFNEGAITFYEEMGYTTATRMMWKSLE
jgi:GNAT superfamily N-acetyltransferase